jgi:CHAT domain-containing protein
MHKIIIVLLLGIIASLIPGEIIAQQSTELETVYKNFRIRKVYPSKTDTVYAAVYGSPEFGPEIGSSGTVTAEMSSEQRSEQELGSCFVISYQDSKKFFTVYIINKHRNKADSNFRAATGDVITLPIKVPKVKIPSLLRKIDLQGTLIYNNNNGFIYAPNRVYQNDNQIFEDSVIQAYTEEVRQGVELFKDNTNPSIRTPAEKGRYKGKTMLEAMAACTTKDLMLFLKYVVDYPRSYRAKDYRIGEVFGGWVIAGAPESPTEVLDSLAAVIGKPALLKQKVTQYKSLIIEDYQINNWIGKAMDLFKSGLFEESEHMYNLIAPILPIINDSILSGTYYIAKAEFEQYKHNYYKVVALCDSGIVLLKNIRDRDNIYYQTQYKKAFAYRQLKQKTKSLAVYSALLQQLDKDSLLTDSTTILSIRARLYREQGNTAYAFEDFFDAITNFTKAYELYKRIGNNAALTLAAEMQSNIAKIYKKQNRNKEAEAIYLDLLEINRSQVNIKDGAETITNIAYLRSQMGNYKKALENYRTAYNLYKYLQDKAEAGYNLSQMGQNYWNLGMYDSAIDAHQKAIGLQKEAENKKYEAYAWSKLGHLYTITGDKNKAITAFDSAIYHALAGADTLSYITYLNDKGEAYENDKDYQKAKILYQQALTAAKKTTSKTSTLESLYRLAGANYNIDTALSRKQYTEALALAVALGNKDKQIYSLLNIGALLAKQSDYVNSVDLFKQALAIAQTESNLFDQAECYSFMGIAADERQEFDSAFAYLNRSLNLFNAIQNKAKIPAIYRRIANLYVSTANYTEAEKNYNLAFQMADSTNNKAEQSVILSERSYLELLRGNNKAAIQHLDSSNVILKASNSTFLQASLYLSYGNYYNRIFENEKSLYYYLLADSIYIKENNIESRITLLNNIGSLYANQRNWNKSLDYLLQAQQLTARQNVLTDVALLIKVNIAEAYYYKKDYKKAQQACMDVEKAATKLGAKRRLIGATLLKGMIFYATKNYSESEKALQQVLQMTKQNALPSTLAETNLYLARIYKEQTKLADALALLLQSEAIIAATENDNDLWEILYEKGNVYFLQNNMDSAIEAYKKSVSIVIKLSAKIIGTEEEKNKLKAEESKVDLFGKLIAAFVKSNKVDEAVYYTNLANLQGIQEKNNEAGIAAGDKQKTEAIEKSKDFLQQRNTAKETLAKETAKPETQQNKELMASMQQIIKTAEEDYQNYIDDLATTYDDIKTSFAETVNPGKFSAYKQNIPDSVACLLYIINNKQLYIFTVTNTETLAFTINLDRNLDSTVNRFLKAVSNPRKASGTGALNVRSAKLINFGNNEKTEDFSQLSAQLYKLLITPVAAIIKDKKTICIIPTGKLSQIPFQALAYQQDQEHFSFLVEDHSIFYTSQMEVFYGKADDKKDMNSLSAFGNPDKSLPKAGQEVLNLNKIIAAAKIYIEDSATEKKARESLVNSKYIHFATHGMLDYNDFRNSYLLFAKEQNADTTLNGKLTIREIKALKISNCDLVTLSACETAVSKEVSKGWYISPANSFLVKGVKTVVASLWPVDDDATSILMTAFYQNLQTMGKAEALRRAQETLSKNPKYVHPYFWSAFLLYGDWR